MYWMENLYFLGVPLAFKETDEISHMLGER